MRTHRTTIGILALLFPASPGWAGHDVLTPAPPRADPAADQTTDPPADPAGVTDLNGLADELRAALGVPAVAVAVTDARRTFAVGASGVRRWGDDDPVDVSDRWHLGSLTKSMTATVAAVLVERGELTWDTTVAQADPALADRVPATARAITLRQLLSHRAGLPDDRSPNALLMGMWTLSGPMTDQRRLAAEAVLNSPANAEPGGAFVYSNAGYVVAAHMLQAVSGEDWESLIRRELFEPLGMTTAGHGPPGLDPADGPQPSGHGRGPDGPRPVPVALGADNPPAFGPAGRVHASIGDLAAYARAHLAGLRAEQPEEGALLPPEVFRVLHADPEGDGYALGWGVTGEGDDRRSMHSGSNTRWLALMLIWPSRDLGVVAAMNALPDADPPVDVIARLVEAAGEIRASAPE
jgi:CubicO group peptidase (beta-lactamase class C family)